MSVVSKCIGAAKKIKHRFSNNIKKSTPVYISPVRRIERVKTSQRVCAMTFDDGPSRLPPSDNLNGEKGKIPLTLALLETLEKYNAKGTFDVIGDTSANYPDKAGEHGSASWGGKMYDHYPDIGKDSDGGAENCHELISRTLEGGHEISSHTYAHIIYGRKMLVYGSRKYLGDLKKVTDDLKKLHSLLKEKYGYEMKLSRPPHYVDKITKNLSSYDAYAMMGYQYMAASFDGAGWLPLSTYEDEVKAMYLPIQQKLADDPDYFCGQIIFQKDGYNMARRTPVADGLDVQLKALDANGYRVVTVSELMEICPFEDIGEGDRGYEDAKTLLKYGMCPAFRDNTVRIDKPVTKGELAMIAFGWKAAERRIDDILSFSSRRAYFADVPVTHPYGAAIQLAVEKGCFDLFEKSEKFCPDNEITQKDLMKFISGFFGKEAENVPENPDRADVFAQLTAFF